MIQLDFEKAFDRVEHNSLLQAFKLFGFPSYITDWVATLFSSIQLCTINNAYTSFYFAPTRGIYQGNPIGPYGFIILIELLAIKLYNCRKIKGFAVKDYVYLLAMFADELNIFMQYDQNSWDATVSILDTFAAISRLKINYDKTTVYRLGSLRNTNAKFYSSCKITWSNDLVCNLRVIIAQDKKTLIELN